MPDREKVKAWLSGLFKANPTICPMGDCESCPYFNKYDCYKELRTDALSLLKEQEAVKPVRDEQTGRIWLCGNCGSYVGFEDNDPDDPNEFSKYCHECGRPVLWEGR